MRRTVLSAALAAAVLVSAWTTGALGATVRRAPAPPLQWPAAASAAEVRTWLVGVRPGTPIPRAALRMGAVRAGPTTLAVAAGRARALGRLLARRGLLSYAEPDVRLRHASVVEASPDAWARGAVVGSTVPWPQPGAEIAIVDELVDATRPDLAGHVRYLNAGPGSQILGSHGTMVASAAAAAADGGGVLGVLPGAPIASYGTDLRCSDVAAGIDAAARQGIRVVNLSLGVELPCFTLYLATQRAFGLGTLVIAASGNEFANGNPVIYPAAFPHVLSVSATTPDSRSAYFSSANLAVDLAAPGVAVPVAVPPYFDTDDGVADGFTTADGTSFSAPMVAGAAAWVLTARPQLSAGQLADVLRGSASDIAEKGWDPDTGWGLLHVAAALAAPEPPDDLGEPNDEILLVDGTVFRGADTPVWSGRADRVLRAWVDAVKDPFDVYRVKLPGRSLSRFSLLPGYGNANLQVFDRPARSIVDGRSRVCRERHAGRALDRCEIVWSGRGTRIVYVVVSGAMAGGETGASYRLRFSRLR